MSSLIQVPFSRDTGEFVQMPSGLVVSAEVAEEYARSTMRPTAIDLFAGAGGFSLGFLQAGFRIVAAVDNDPFCARTYLANLGAYPCQMHFVEPEDQKRMEKALRRETKGKKRKNIEVPITSGAHRPPNIPGVEHYWLGDIRKISGQEILREIGMQTDQVDCVIGGPPCQGFTRLGKRNVMDPRNNLVFEFCRLVVEIRPKTMVFENVPDILNSVTPQGLPVVDAMVRILADGGFSTYDALKRALAAQSGSVGLLKGDSPQRKRRSKTRIKYPPHLQLNLSARPEGGREKIHKN